MKKLMMIAVAWALLVHGLASEGNALGVGNPTTAGVILTGNNFQSDGSSNSTAVVTIEWKDGSAGVVDVQTATPRAMVFYWNANHTLPSTTGVAAWTKTTNDYWGTPNSFCRMKIGAVVTGTQTHPPVQ